MNRGTKLPYEGELLHLAIPRKREKIACTNCGSTGNMRKNGGGERTMRALRCKMCNKHMTGQNIRMALEEKFGPEWREKILRDGRATAEPKSNPTTTE